MKEKIKEKKVNTSVAPKVKTEKAALKPVVFSPVDTRFIKGFAILLLMWHHLCASPDNYAHGTTFPSIINVAGKSLTAWFAGVGNISITIFSFLGGYALARCYTKPHFFSNKIISLYKSYWKIFFIFVPIGFLFFAHQDAYCVADYVLFRFSQFDLQGFIFNLVGFSATYNIEWWFFFPYLKALLIGMVFIHLNKNRRSYYVEFAEMFIFMMILEMLLSLSYNEGFGFIGGNSYLMDYLSRTDIVSCMLMGCIFGKYELLPRLINWAHQLPLLIRKLSSVAVILFVIAQRNGSTYDYIFVPLLTVALFELFGFFKLAHKCMSFVGKHSANMYYMHTFLIFYFGVTAKLIYKPNSSLLSFLIFVASCLLLSVGINKLYEQLGRLLEKTFILKRGVFEEPPEDVHQLEPAVIVQETKEEPVSIAASDEYKEVVYTPVPVETIKDDSEKNEKTENADRADNTDKTENTGKKVNRDLPDVLFVEDYSEAFNCLGCQKELRLKKVFCTCPDCGIYYIKNKYRDDSAVIEMCSGNDVVWMRKK